jgi:hypothetical protein
MITIMNYLKLNIKALLADGATNDYNYKILDTIAIDGRFVT